MVLVLAAWYTYRHYYCDQEEEPSTTAATTAAAAATTAQGDDNDNDNDKASPVLTASPCSSSSGSWQDDLSQQWQRVHRVGSTLVETTVGRCHSTSPPPPTDQPTVELSPLHHPHNSMRHGNMATRMAAPPPVDDDVVWPNNSNPPNLATTPAHVRHAWVDAVFGATFPPTRAPPRAVRGTVGGFAPSCATTVHLQAAATEKLGLTLSRLPLGLYVRAVAPDSEAAICGVTADSILVSINGLALLAEPSKQALERLWQYQGFLQTPDEGDDEGREVVMRQPVVLRFWKNGIDSKVLLLSPIWGLTWASCGNFALVKRSYGAAAAAGIQRGALVARVQEETLRTLDHVATAEALRNLQEGTEAIRMVLAVPPPDMRTGFYERAADSPEAPATATNTTTLANSSSTASTPPPPRRTIRTDDGVQVKFHALQLALVSNLVCQTAVGACMDPLGPVESLTELAERVSAGRLEEPLARRSYRTNRLYMACPRLPNLMDHWNPIESLLYCVEMHRLHYQAEKYRLPTRPPLTVMRSLVGSLHATDVTLTFLLQFLSVICIPVPATEITVPDEKKTEEADAYQKQAKTLTSLLLKVSRRDEGYCQRLYFLLRSFISSMETRRPAAGSRNLLALMNCLELLRFAEKELSAHSPSVETAVSMSPRSPMVEEKKGILPFRRKKKGKTHKRPEVTSSTSMPDAPTQSPLTPRSVVTSHSAIERPRAHALSQSPSVVYEHMSDFLTQLDRICGTIERSLQKSFRQKIADWAMQPWSASKDTALANVTKTMRESLAAAADSMMLVNPVESSELLSAVDTEECYILPSAHFPILLTFDVSERRASDSPVGEERIYRTTVELINLESNQKFMSDAYVVHAAVAGKIVASDASRCIDTATTKHAWFGGNKLVFDSRSSWGAPQTLSLRMAPKAESAAGEEVSFAWVDLQPAWEQVDDTEEPHTVRTFIALRDPREQMFDEQGYLPDTYRPTVSLELKITTDCVDFDEVGGFSRKRMLLYKHDDDLRQESFAVQFIRTCDRILQSAGLDLKLLTFHCVPVGTRRGFVEWVPGSVPLSEVCQPFLGSILDSNDRVGPNADGQPSPSMFAKAGLTKYESLRRLGGQQSESFQRLAGGQIGKRGSFSNNPVQDYLRSVAFDLEAPYLIRRDVMDTYVKSSAGYSVITYILGVGDRHLDNLLLHQSGSFFHCDYSFLLGIDPKKYLPMRITEDMVHGMGGIESDNYAKFLSLSSAAFLALRRPEIVRVLLSMIRLMEPAGLPDITENQSMEQAILGVRDRLKLELTPDEAVIFMEELIESSLNSKLWIAVDAMHSLGKKF